MEMSTLANISSFGRSSTKLADINSLKELLNEVELQSNQPHHRMHLLADELKRMSTIFRERQLVFDLGLQTRLLDFCYKYFNYTLEVVNFACVDIFFNLLHVHSLSCNDCGKECCLFVAKMEENLMNITLVNKCRLKALIIWLKFNRKCISSRNFIEALYLLLNNSSLIISISELIIYDASLNEEHANIHLESLSKAINNPSKNVYGIVRQRLLPLLFKNARIRKWLIANLDFLIEHTEAERALELELILANLCISYNDTNRAQWKDFITEKHLLNAFIHASEELRLSAWKLLCFHPKSTWPVSSLDICLAKIFLVSNMAEQNSSKRQEIFKGLRKLLMRIRESAKLKSIEDLDVSFSFEEYSFFLRFLFDLAFKSLVPGANFNRRLSALLILESLYERMKLKNGSLDTLREDFKMDEWLTRAHYEQLLACLDDTYLLCQSIAFGILDQIPSLLKGSDYTNILNQALVQLTNIRSNVHLFVGARLQFVCRKRPELLEKILSELTLLCYENLKKIEESILEICDNAPIYPILHSLYSILQLYTDFSSLDPKTCEVVKGKLISDIIPICFRASSLVSPIVHSLSPEGFAPDEWLDQDQRDKQNNSSLESRVMDHNTVSQKLLIGCWRAHQNISKIFRYVLENLEYPNVLSVDLLQKIEDYLWLQLTECKHCGAFEIAAVAFDSLCRRLWRIKSESSVSDQNGPYFPEELLDRILEALYGGKDIDKLCSTRRSAGLPHLVNTLLLTLPKNKSIALVERSLTSLLNCEKLPELLQVHCINVLKVVFSETQLSEKVLPFAEKTFFLCFDGFEKSSWPVRNALCQLYASLVRRIFGSSRVAQRTLQIQDSCMKSSFDFFTRFPGLFTYLHRKLYEYDSTSSEFTIFPIMILLCHLFPSPTETKYQLSVYIPGLVRILFVCKSEKLRELIIAALISISEFVDLEKLFNWTLKKDFVKRNDWNSFEAVLLLILTTIDFGRGAEFLPLFENFLQDEEMDSMPDYVLQNFLTIISLAGSPGLQQNVIRSIKRLIESKEKVVTLHLSTRPIGCLLAKNSQLWSDVMERSYLNTSFMAEIRYEAYRAIVLNNLDSTYEVLEFAVKDFETCFEERHLEFITLLLIRNIGTMNNESRAVIIERSESLLDSRTVRKLSSKINLLELALISNDYELRHRYLKLLDEARKDDEIENRLKSLHIFGLLLNKASNDQVLCMACLLLQDEEIEVRRAAAKIVANDLLGKELDLNPSVLWPIALDKFPKLANEVENEFEDTLLDENDLFESCSRNPYAEKFEMPYFELVQEQISNL